MTGATASHLLQRFGLALIVSRSRAGQRGEVIVAIDRPSKNAALRYQREEALHTDKEHPRKQIGKNSDLSESQMLSSCRERMVRFDSGRRPLPSLHWRYRSVEGGVR